MPTYVVVVSLVVVVCIVWQHISTSIVVVVFVVVVINPHVLFTVGDFVVVGVHLVVVVVVYVRLYGFFFVVVTVLSWCLFLVGWGSLWFFVVFSVFTRGGVLLGFSTDVGGGLRWVVVV